MGLIYSNQRSSGEKPLQFVFPFSSFSCPGLLALLPWETGSPLLPKCKAFEMLEININVEWEVRNNCWQQGGPSEQALPRDSAAMW